MLTSVEVLERCQTDRGELVLQRRGQDFEIISNGTFLMATYNGESERQLVRQGLQVVQRPHRVLIGGLGVGFSLAEALRDGRVRQVDVFEIETKIVEWNRTRFGAESSEALRDERTRIHLGDLVEWLYGRRQSGSGDDAFHGMDRDTSVTSSAGEERGTGEDSGASTPNSTGTLYDVICLDIDNGSDWTVHEGNRELYSDAGMARLHQILAPNGVVTFWNARRDKTFEQRLEQYFREVTHTLVEHPVGEPDVVYIVKTPLAAISDASGAV